MAIAVLWPWFFLYWLDVRRQRKVMQSKYKRLMTKYYQPVIFKSLWAESPWEKEKK